MSNLTLDAMAKLVVISIALYAHRQEKPDIEVSTGDDAQQLHKAWLIGKLSSVRDSMDNFGPAACLQSLIVQDAISLNQTQKNEIKKLAYQILEDRKHKVIDILNNRDSDAEMPTNLFQECEVDLRRSHLKGIAKILDRAQATRFWQIAIQIEGHASLAWPEVQDMMYMFPEQRDAMNQLWEAYLLDKNKIKKTTYEYYKKFKTDKQSIDKDSQISLKLFFSKHAPKILELQNMQTERRALLDRSIARLLSKGQKQRFTKLMGRTIDLEELEEFVKPNGGFEAPEDGVNFEKWKKSRMDQKKSDVVTNKK